MPSRWCIATSCSSRRGSTAIQGCRALATLDQPDAFDEQVVKTFEAVVVTDRTTLGNSSSGPEDRPAESSWMSSPGPFGALTRTI